MSHWEKLKGKFIVIDGTDGAGKSTQVEGLVHSFQAHGVDTVQVKDPGGTTVGDAIRKVILDPEHKSMTTWTEVLLFLASRVQLLETVITPALNAGKCVVSDRWMSSTICYQPAGSEDDVSWCEIWELHDALPFDFIPDLTVIIDVPLETTKKRLKARGKALTRIEEKGDEYFERVRENFTILANRERDYRFINGDGGVDSVTALLQTRVWEWLRAQPKLQRSSEMKEPSDIEVGGEGTHLE